MKIILMPSDSNQSTLTNAKKKMRSKNVELAKSTWILLAKHLSNL